MTLLTTTLRKGQVVLAKLSKTGEIHPVTYVNNSQAEKKVQELKANGIECYFSEFKYPKYIYIN